MTQLISFLNDRLSNKEAANYLGVKPETMDVWRSTSRYSIPFCKIGRKVFYRKSDLDAFIESRTQTKTA
ncbi:MULTISPECIES: helix-turn-helix domain-containing protein [Shewanella]|uniref:Helix-turn-helix domain-containing protein n=1 Tax=Shewanella marisflavi TaxID=260364 RepID=A0ABX5WP65_9GAMM|nr:MULTISPECIES: helix-turn-helix domain-containing protein [Shewanella]QDF75936.1 helix-turn-helix domain-containing protein [Shewanella marisflavi]